MRNLSDLEIIKLKTDIPKHVGEQIVYYRKLKGLSQTELGAIVGKDRQYIYKIENGRVTPNIVTIAIITTALQITLSELFQNIK
jgi:transcriptional regulator with XRE-family HTH domain